MSTLRWIRTLAASLALATLLVLGGCSSTASPTLPIPPPTALSSAPNVDGFVTIEGAGVEPEALVFAFNERIGEGIIGNAEGDGTFELVLQAESGDSITVWQMVGTSTSALLEVIVPRP